MLLTRPKRSGDTHSVKEWWKGGGVSTCYVQCTIFDVTVGGNTCKLVLDTNMSTKSVLTTMALLVSSSLVSMKYAVALSSLMLLKLLSTMCSLSSVVAR